jgi:acyl carrier protein
MKNTDQKILSELNNIFNDVFDEDDISINLLTTAQDIDGWDSLNHIRLIVTIEKFYKIRFTSLEIGELKNIGDMVALILIKLKISP